MFFPAAPLFLFIHGKDITIPKGTEITAFINGDVPLDMAKFQPASAAPTAGVATAAAVQTTLEITSTPAGAEIQLDGNFSGDTPSSITVTPGEHTIKVSRSGYKPWERKMTTTSGSVKIVAELEQQNQPADAQSLPVEAQSAPKPQQ